MPKPTPTASQLAAINAEIAGNTAKAQALTDSAAAQGAIIAQKQEVDTAFKNLFDYYNLKIIKPYDDERKSINGTYVVSPIVEADIVSVSNNPPSGRLVPTPPSTDIVRIPEFDGGAYTGLASDYEQKHILDQADVENVLVNGYGAGTYPLTLSTSTALTPSSTTLSLTDTASPINITVNTVFVLVSGSNLAVVKVLTITPNNPPTPPPYISDLTIELIVPPTGTIPSGTNLQAFTGFTNTERTNKVASNPSFQPLMNHLVNKLQARINDRISRLNEQLTALAANEDPDGVSAISAATANANASKNFLTNYLITTDISNTGLASLSSERTTRSGQLTARLAQILAAYTGQTENYYDKRYEAANNRGNTERGTLRALKNAQQAQNTLSGMAASLTTANAVLNSITS